MKRGGVEDENNERFRSIREEKYLSWKYSIGQSSQYSFLSIRIKANSIEHRFWKFTLFLKSNYELIIL